jgi:predicted unusual protein kinase regulating ubiquinone biosynthesis (AarF/ABC1/UbiB family)
MENNMALINKRKSRVPSTRLGRFTRLGMAAGELAIGGLTEAVRNVGRSNPTTGANVFLTVANANKLAKRLAGMRGAAMKMGQMLSMESADLLPKPFADALALLRNTADSMPEKQLRGVLRREYGRDWEYLFKFFDYQPIAAASIGQVHRAVTLDGRVLALKIQYPGVAKSINSDVDNMAMLLRMSRMLPADMDLDGLIADAKRQLRREADYELELDHLKLYGSLLLEDEKFVVPGVHEDFSTKRILAMDFVEGVPLESLGELGVSQQERNNIGRDLQQLLFRELFEFRTMQSDPNFANYLYQPAEGRIVLLDFGSTITFDKVFTDNYAGIASAIIEGDVDASRHYAQELGYLASTGSDEYAERLLEILQLICEPIHTRGIYDFGNSDMFSKARDIGMELFLNGSDNYVIPPPQTNFLHRKLMGAFMLNTRIGARIDVQELIRPYLPTPALKAERTV